MIYFLPVVIWLTGAAFGVSIYRLYIQRRSRKFINRLGSEMSEHYDDDPEQEYLLGVLVGAEVLSEVLK